MRVYFCAAPCGSGRTHALVQRADDWSKQGRRIIILQPTKKLIGKTIQNELTKLSNPPRHKVFHGDTVSGSVAAALTDYLKQTDDEGQIVFATHQVLPYIGFWANKDTWDVFVDEVPQAHRHHSYEIPHTHEFITDLIDLVPHDARYSRVTINDRAALERIAKNEDRDEIYEKFRELSQTLLNRHWDSFVNTDKFHALKAGKSQTLSIHSVLNPSVLEGFGSVTMAAANFTDSMIHRLWSQKGVEFREETDLALFLRFQEHDNGHLVLIKYAVEQPWSRKHRDSKLNPNSDDKTTIFDAYVQGAKTALQGMPFLWQGNNDAPETLFDGAGQRLPNVPHGLNDFSHIDNIVFLSSLNPRSDHFRFLQSQGLDGDQVRRAIYLEAAYQSVMRTSIRDRDNNDRKIVIVPDKAAALYLHGLFPGSGIGKLESGIPDQEEPKKPGRPRKHQSEGDRKAQYRQRQKQKLLDDLLLLKKVPYHAAQESLEIEDEIGIEDSYTHFVPDLPLTSTLYRGKNSGTPLGYIRCGNPDLFIKLLHSWHLRALADKEANFLISPAIFDPNHPDRDGNQRRGRRNIRYLQHIWLDFDNGELPPDAIAELFPFHRLVIFDTYNHTSDHPRFRVLFLTHRQLTSEAYEIVWDNIAAKLEESGYSVGNKKNQHPGSNVRPSGLDVSKRSPTSLFYAPCQAKNPADSFFRDYNGPDRQLLDPTVWIENNVVPFPVPFTTDGLYSDHGKVNQAMVEKATEEWRESIHHPGEGNRRFFAYAVALRTAGMSLPDIESKLIGEARFGRSPKERREQIPSIIASLKKSWRRAA